MKKRISMRLIIIVAVFIVLGIAAIGYMFRGVDKSVGNQKAIYSLTSDELFSAFNDNETAANEKFIGKVIEIKGEVSEIEKTDSGQLVLLLSVSAPMGGVRCTFETQQDEILKKVKQGTLHTVKGKCSGFLTEVVLDNCSLTD